MAKRYYESRKVGSSMYDTMKRHEREDGDMLHSDSSAMANMPQQLKMKYYPKDHYGYEAELIDTYQGIDFQEKQDRMGQKRGRYPKKY